ncbi:MAG: DUF481 domain-containing protein [Planctomycetota bacterium]
MPSTPQTPTLLLLTVALLAAPISAPAGTVTLTNEDEITGTVTRSDDAGVTLQHPDLGTVDIPSASIDSVELDEDDPVYVEPPKPDFFWGWDKSVEAGLTGSDGNTDNLNLYAAFRTDYEDDTDRWLIRASIFYGEEDGENTRNEWDTELFKDWLLPDEDYFFWANAKYEHDRFTGWEDRVSAFAGLGYDLVDEDTYNLLGRVGAGANYEFGEINDLTPELFLGLEGEWDVTEDSTFSYYTRFFPSLDPAFSEFRNVSGLAYKVSMDAGRGLSLKVGAENEYNSDVAPGTEENDLKYYAALVYDF